MDKKSVLAIIIITIVILLLPTYYKLINGEQKQTHVPQKVPVETESVPAQQRPENLKTTDALPAKSVADESIKETMLMDTLTRSVAISDITIETPLIHAKMNNMGGGKFSSWDLKNYSTWHEDLVKIIDKQINNGLDFSFITTSGEKIDASRFAFTPAMEYPGKILLGKGEKKKISMATVLSIEPDILLLDEPTANLDPYARRKMIDMLVNLRSTKIIASHDIEMLLEVCDRCILLDHGRIAAIGKVEDILTNTALLRDHGLDVPTVVRLFGSDALDIVRNKLHDLETIVLGSTKGQLPNESVPGGKAR